MARKARSLHKEFCAKIAALNRTRLNFESAFRASIINEGDIGQAYAGLCVEVFASIENLIGTLFIGMLNGSIKHENGQVSILVTIRPVSMIENIILNSKTYMEWLPFSDNTLARAKSYFSEGRPFTLLTEEQKGKIKNYTKIRNAIAHKSKKAESEFNTLISGLILLPFEKSPQGYLRNIPNRATGKTQLEIIMDDVTIISSVLCC
jgi:hypothetical protein